MRLTNSCWGKVRIRVEEKEGDMCGDTWTEDKSVKLCEKLNCGTPIKAHNSPKDGDILFKSLHPTNQTTDLTQSIFVKNQDNDKSCKQKPAYVVCSGNCFLKVILYYKNIINVITCFLKSFIFN